MNNFSKILLVGLISVISFTACQNTAVVDEKKPEEIVEVDLGVPFSQGPNSAPSVVGPTTPPPGSELIETESADAANNENATRAEVVQSAQAVTQKEDIRLTLPIKTE